MSEETKNTAAEEMNTVGENNTAGAETTVKTDTERFEDLLKSDPETAATVRDITSNINARN